MSPDLTVPTSCQVHFTISFYPFIMFTGSTTFDSAMSKVTLVSFFEVS